jgi:prepilin-type N-terminal cleavage/methylation domain-containing protein
MKTRSMRFSPNERGFTLVELMVALAIAAFFIAGTMTIVDLSTKSYRAQERVSDAQQGLRAGMDTMVHRIRMAGYDPLAESSGAIAVNGIQTAMTTKIQVMADYNADGAINAADFEEITYQYNSATQQVTQLLYESAGIAGNTPQVLVENVSGLTFTYLDDEGNSTATLSKIVTVVVQMTVSDRNRETGETFQRTLTTRINCRNLRL